MDRDIERKEEKVPLWLSKGEKSKKPLPFFSDPIVLPGQQRKEITLGRGQRINRARGESEASSTSTAVFGATKRKLQEEGIGPGKEPGQWEDNPAFEELPPKSSEGPPPKKLQFVPAGGSTVRPEDMNWDLEEEPGPPLLEDITEGEEEDLPVGDEEEMDEAINAAEDDYQKRMCWLAEMAKTSPHLQELVGVDDPKVMGFVFAAGLRKVQELEHVHDQRKKRDILSYTKLAKRFQINLDILQECCVAGKLRVKKTRK